MDKKIAYEIAKKIRNYMLSNKLQRISLKDYLQSYNDEEKILFNNTKSPNGACGMFLLLKKARFSIDEKLLNNLERQVLEVLKFNKAYKEIENATKSSKISRLQDRFEEYTEIILKNTNNKVSRVDQQHMNEYDFKVKNLTLCVTVEVKSDKWKHTGNISLELLRDYEKDYERNIGSILKTEATFWQVYYYDSKDYYNKEVSSEMFLVSQLKEKTYEVLEQLGQKLK